MPSKVENALHEAVEAPLGSRQSRRPSRASKTCILTCHDEGWCKQTVLVSPELFLYNQLRPIVLQIVPLQDPQPDSPARRDGRSNASRNASPSYVFYHEQVGQDILSGYPSLEVSILQPIATALGFANRSKIVISEVEAEDHLASHVEIAFKDAYLTRADMWRLLTSDLVGTSVYKNQKVLFINSVKASIKAIYANGRRVQSALLDASTKAVFRSDSSRYYILIQMSKEMWDFDSGGGGEIIFSKLVNGFLPELFRRWEALGTSHSVSVILFTRMGYENHPSGDKYQDYYRVLTTELMSSESATIILELKKEFRTFLRDVSLAHASLDEPTDSSTSTTRETGRIEGTPMPAVHGNVLEAIHTASLQFLRSNATCDLRRTGLSLIIITPAAGLFEVNRGLLTRTTETLIENGIYIDLVCLAKTPLHSSPLFRYSTAETEDKSLTHPLEGSADDRNWRYTIPHWVDVSFWQGASSSKNDSLPGSRQNKLLANQKSFDPRVRMYEIQMIGLMQNEFSISIAHLPCPHSIRFPKSFGMNTRIFKSKTQLESNDLEGAKAVYSQGYKELSKSESPDKSPSQQYMQPFTNLLNWMDDYDERAFKILEQKSAHPVVAQQGSAVNSKDLHVRPSGSSQVHEVHQHLEVQEPETPLNLLKRKTSSASTSSKYRSPSARLNPLSRQFGPGFKGFGTAKATATTQVSAEPVVSNAAAKISPEISAAGRNSSLVEHNFPKSSASRPSTRSSVLSPMLSDSDLSATVVEKSRPIDIVTKKSKASALSIRDERELLNVDKDKLLPSDEGAARVERQPTKKQQSSLETEPPWMTMLNPSNPKKLTADMTSRLGRWQHVFPKPTQTSTIKWKSLCSPACVPLTTEEFPTSAQLRAEYVRSEYEVRVPKEKESSENEDFGEWLIRELVASRLTREFSVVVGTRPAETLGLPQAQWLEFLHEKGMSKPGVKIIMSRGTEIHELLNIRKGVVGVTRHLRKEKREMGDSDRSDKVYRPLIRTAYAHAYTQRSFSFVSESAQLDWNRLDSFIANDEEELNKPYPESLQHWKARFVLIPIAVSGSRKRTHSPEDNEEEIRLEGIRKLTQMWQRNRHLSPNERSFESKRKDANPLDIVYQTRSASAIVSSELNDSILTDPEHRSTQLLPEKDLFERAKLNIFVLSKTLQGDKGVRMLDRRWHLRLHYNCFIGIDLTTWLVNNFRDIDTRDEAVEFGNELMKEGLFVHVEKRHNFRDGNFFYQIAERYRTPRQDVRSSWFGRLAERSVPATPLADIFGEEAKGLHHSEVQNSTDDQNAGENGDSERDAHPVPQTSSPKTSVILSKQLVYDMDHRKKSHRRELVNLHVDRISSADDCYHLRLDWVTATPKLIEDTVESWASTAERSGLRLVEVPLLEARRFTNSHPFRHPYYIKLAKDPPQQPPHAATLEESSGNSRISTENDDEGADTDQRLLPLQQEQEEWPYHRAILKKFDFVLDQEAAANFPSEVSVQYSWGAPDYQLPQYITRSGRLLAQITHDGRFLFLINQLYADRGSAAREAQRAAAGAPNIGPMRSVIGETLELPLQTPRRTPITPAPASTGLSKMPLSPFASPMLRAATGSGNADIHHTQPLPQSGAVASPSGRSLFSNAQLHNALPALSRSELMTVTQLRVEIEAFCSNVQALESFYDEELHRSLATVPATPIVKPMSGLSGIEEAASTTLPALTLKEHITDDSQEASE